MPRRILIVEDADTAATTLEIVLQTIPDVEVARVTDGLRAVEYLAAEPGRAVDAVVTDLEMPFLDGYQLIERLRREPRRQSVPIVVVSGCQDPRAGERALELGADAYFSKPWSPLAVRRKVEELLDHSSLRAV